MNIQGKKASAIGLLAAGAVAGGILAGTLGANAASSDKGTASPPAASGSGTPGPGGAQPMRTDEKLVTGSTLSTLTAAAKQAVPGGTIIRVETDAGDAVYEAHMKKADGSLVTVKFDKDLKVTKVEDGMGQGDPHGQGGPGGPPPPSSSGTTTG